MHGICKIFMEGPVIADCTRTSTRSSQGFLQDLDQELHTKTLKRKSHKVVSIHETPKSILEALSDKHL